MVIKETVPLIISTVIFFITFVLILMERVHRTVIGMVGAVLLVTLGTVFGFYGPQEALKAIDFNTIGLLMGMMIIVVILEETGFFQYLAIISAQRTRGDPWKLVVVLGTVTTVVSFFLDNVTTVVLIAPVTIIVAGICRISAVPLLIAEALLSNTGGVATLVGDPPNIMIGSAAGFSFNDFITHLAPIVVVTWIATLLTLKFVFRRALAQKPENIEALLRWNAKSALKDVKTCKKTLCVLGFVIVLFFFHHMLNMPAMMVALIGAALALILNYSKKDPQPILAKVEWSVLLFFTSLFVLVGGLEHTGALRYVASLVMKLTTGNMLVAALAILWVSALMSAVVDNIPFTIAMIPIILNLKSMGVPVDLFWWSLALGVGFGGNATPIGSTANIVVVSKSEQTDEPITFAIWLKSGMITMLITCTIASAALVVLNALLSR